MVLAPSKSYLVSKAGPLPIWGWMGIGLGGALGYALYKQRKAKSSADAAGNQAGTPGYTLPSNIQPQTTYLSQETYSQVVNGSRRDHPPFGGRQHGRPIQSPEHHDHDGPDNPDGVWVTTTTGGSRSTLNGILAEFYPGDTNADRMTNRSNLIRSDPRNKDAFAYVTGRDQQLAPGASIWVPFTAAGNDSSNPQTGGPRAPRPGDNGRGDGRMGGPSTGPGPMPVQNQNRDRGQSNGGGGYGPGGQRANTAGRR